jgi:heptosyltransferase-2
LLNLPPQVAVFQPRPGLGDLIWHLPHIRAIAGATQSGQVILITKPSTQADLLLGEDPAIERIVWFDRNPRVGRGRHDGVFGFPRLVQALRSCRVEACVLLHHGASLAAAMRLAGIPHRYGYGYGAQRRWLNHPPFLGEEVRYAEAFDQATAFTDAAGLVHLPPPSITLDPVAARRVAGRLAGWPAPVVALGVGSHGAIRQWGAGRFAELANALLGSGAGCVLLIAAAHEAPLVRSIREGLDDAARVHDVIGWTLPEVAALLAQAALFIGNDSGLMNLRAAVGRPAYGLFGASGPLRHSPLIRPIVPAAGPRAGMEAISVALVLDALGKGEKDVLF